jgi:hypothetical protein
MVGVFLRQNFNKTLTFGTCKIEYHFVYLLCNKEIGYETRSISKDNRKHTH